MPKEHKKAVVLLSGGLDSATTLAIAKNQDYNCYALTFIYGQRHRIETDSAKKAALAIGTAEHRIIEIGLGSLGGSALTDINISIPKDRNDFTVNKYIPITYVPARNIIFLS